MGKPFDATVVLGSNIALSSTVEIDGWLETLERCAAKAGRPLASIEVPLAEREQASLDSHKLSAAWMGA